MRWSQALLVVAAAVAVVGCGSGSSVVSKDVVDAAVDVGQADGAVLPDGKLDVDPTETGGIDAVWDAPDAASPTCQPGEGCFLDKCKDNGECQSGWCVQHLGEGVCSQPCQEECPAGWKCRQVSGGGPDVLFICVSEYATLCRPCAGAGDCKSPGGSEDVCVAYGTAGSFCGGKCEANDDCPWGFSCKDVQTVDGIDVRQCVADAGDCPCTDLSVELVLWTPCAVQNEFGKCGGKRVCSTEGLLDCDAQTPGIETCNGTDDDCDGSTDEPLEVDGDYVNLCDDGNPCTDDQCKGGQGCLYEKLQSGECIHGDPCTVADHCVAGECVGNPVICDDDNPCTDDTCDGAGGCQFEANSAGCDDGDPCTVADNCSQTVCAGVSIPCDCQKDADCALLEDGDLCNGTLHCKLEEWPYKCAVKPGTVAECPVPPAGPDAP
ncbi:MAG: hypothetical protein FJ109_10220, partial [Deltaproteobacteria bacterium]|nr:hypothetical protein [Deltaproteobacteria bacterium]